MARHRSAPPTTLTADRRRDPDRSSRARLPADRRAVVGTPVNRIPVDRVAILRRSPAARTGWVPDSDTGPDLDGDLGIGIGIGIDERPGEHDADRDHGHDDDVHIHDDEDQDGHEDLDAAQEADDAEPGPAARSSGVAGPEVAAGTNDAMGSDSAADRPAAGRLRARRVRHGWSRFSETWVPEPLRDARVDPGRRGALLLSLIAALAAVAAAVGVWRDRPEPRPVQAVVAASLTDTVDLRSELSVGSRDVAARPTPAAPPVGSAAVPVSNSDPPSAAPAVIAVSVTGQVRRPGLVRIPARSRVADAVAAAGGVSDDADLTGLNLASVLSDGDSVVVGDSATAGGRVAAPSRTGSPVAGPPGTPPAESAAAVDLNAADAGVLETLPGVGPVMAGNIIGWRELNGAFTSIEQLQEVTGIGPARFAQLSPLVTVG